MRLPRFAERVPETDPPGVTPAWLVRSVNAVAWVFVAILVMTVFLRSLDIARDKSVPLEVSHAGLWSGEAWAFWFPLFVPLVLAAIALPWTAKIIIPAFCAFDWRIKRHRAPKIWCAVVTFFVAIVTMTSGFPLYHGAFNERFKQEAVKLEQVDMGRAALAAEKESIDEDLKGLAASPNKYQAGAALAGAEAWAKRIATAEADKDPQLGMIKKALSDAERGDQLRKDRKAAIQALALAPTKASAMEQVTGGESYGSDALVGFINAWWGFALFVVIEMCALIAGWLAYMMQMSRTEQLADYEASQDGPVTDGGALKIEDHSDEWQVKPQDVTYDENGDELIPVRMKNKVYYRRKSKKKDEAQAPLNANDSRAPKSMFDGISAPDSVKAQSDLEADDGVSNAAIEHSLQAGMVESEQRDGLDVLRPGDESGEVGEQNEQENLVQDFAESLEALTHAQEDQRADEPAEEVFAESDQDGDGNSPSELVRTDELSDDLARAEREDLAVQIDDQAPIPDGTTDPIWPEVSETEDGQFEFEGEQPEEPAEDETEVEDYDGPRRLPAPEAAE